MSFSIVRSLSRVLPRKVVLQNVSRAFQSSSVSPLAAIHGQRGFTRSLWNLGKVNTAKPCGCCGLHTEGDKEFCEFLKDEIKYEKEHEKASKDLPKISGFQVTKSDGSEVILTKQLDSELVTVKFSVNNSVDNDMEFDEQDEQQGADEELVSRPVFNVEMNRGKETFHVQCAFQPPEMMEQTEGQEEKDSPFDIQEVTLLKNGAEWGPTDYVVAGTNMDGNMYDMILNMMDERGLDAKFAEELVQFATSYEHKQYISFLDRLKDFVAC